MAFSRRELILQWVEAQLATARPGDPAGLRVGRSPATAAEAGRLPRQDVLLAAPPERLGEVVAYSASGDQVERTFTFAVVSRYTSPNGPGAPPIDQAGDTLTSRTVAALQGDTTCGGLALDLRELGTDWHQESGSQRYGEASQYFEATFETRRTDSTAAPD